YPERVVWQTFAYDWLGNTSQTHDDREGFYDRSLGTIVNSTAGNKPYQLASASNKVTPAAPREGALATAYDAAGNLIRLNVERAGTCLPTGSNRQERFASDWGEVGRLVRARRWDVSASNLGTPTSTLPAAAPDADLRYAYDASDNRVIKS